MNANASVAPGELELSYVTHSGFGHQLQSLLRGIFIANLSNRVLLVPPMMSHATSLNTDGLKGCKGAAQKWEYHTKTGLLRRSNDQIAKAKTRRHTPRLHKNPHRTLAQIPASSPLAACRKACVAGGDDFAVLFDLRNQAAVRAGCSDQNTLQCTTD